MSAEDTPITTSPAGFESKTTVNVSVVPDSFTEVVPLDSTTVKPGESKQFIPSPSWMLLPSPKLVTFTVPLEIFMSLALSVSTSQRFPFFSRKSNRPSK